MINSDVVTDSESDDPENYVAIKDVAFSAVTITKCYK